MSLLYSLGLYKSFSTSLGGMSDQPYRPRPIASCSGFAVKSLFHQYALLLLSYSLITLMCNTTNRIYSLVTVSALKSGSVFLISHLCKFYTIKYLISMLLFGMTPIPIH